AGMKADTDAVRALAERTEGNALAAKQDIEKLKLLYPAGTIDADAVRDVVADSARYGAFDLADRMLSGDVPGAVRAVEHLRAEGAEPVAVMAALTWVIRQWAQVQTRVDGGADPEQACGQAFIARPRVPAFVRAIRRTPRAAAVYGYLRQAATIDQLSKSTGGKEQAWEELLTLVSAAAGRRVMRPMAVSAS
ncbi:MAG TPA: DNA polymerase III subunit delta, partial [Nevskiaceae bacterium]|nr:DNA polymerase III subunit delta [Nevskiaceae bacterium]